MRIAAYFLVVAAACVPGAEIEFNRDVRPILSDKCFACHGPDAKAKGIPLRLDIEAEAKKAVILPGNAADSRLIHRITTDKKPLRMPPAATGLALTPSEIETLKAWVDQGAKWQKHWAFLPPVKPEGNIDSLVRARLSREGLQMSPQADRPTLLRRVTFDLTGLPPTPAEVDAFLTDKRPDAYERVVDRLLASPRYGERMAARWLDAARYADTNGYQYDGERVMWRWRDYVIESFNKNKPFDKFVVEQVAGDMLPNATFEQKLATGFNRNHRGNTEDGIVAEEYAVEYVVDRVETTSAVFMGLTMGCARCHSHKYDPISHKEFYQFYAYFNNVPERGRAMKYGNSPPLMPAPTAKQQAEMTELDGNIRAIENRFRQHDREIVAERAAWERTLGSKEAYAWAPAGYRDTAMPFDKAGSAGHLGAARRFDATTVQPAAKGSGEFDIEDRFSFSAWIYSDGTPDGTIASRKAGDSFKGKGIAWHVIDGKPVFHIISVWASDALRVESEEKLTPGRWHHVAVTYSGSKMAEDVLLYIDGKLAKTRIDSDTLYRPFRNAGGKFPATLKIAGGAGSTNRFHGSIDEFHSYARVLTPEEIATMAAGKALADLAAKPEAERSPAESRQLREGFFEFGASQQWKAAWADLVSLREKRERLVRTFPSVMIMAESPVTKKTHLLLRGAYDKPADEVQPGLPAALPPLPSGAPNNRLGLALWMVDRSNPLTARVEVNRIWQSLFGTGLVKTAEDFGQQGEWPSHPELLDWLAVDFQENGWDVKALLKKIVTSDTYRQSSKVNPELLQKDPDNRLLARGPRIRLSAEMIRDAALFEAGLLHEKLGGPSVKPYQPDGLWKEVIMQDTEYVQDKGPDLYRRGLYTYWKRTAAPPMMMNFDASQREACMVRENRTNTPLQALNMMNDVTFLEAARFIGQRMILEGGPDTASRLRRGFLIVAGRTPSQRELDVLSASLAFHADRFATHPEDAGKFVAQGDSAPDKRIATRELAAYMAVASLLMNTDEAVTKE